MIGGIMKTSRFALAAAAGLLLGAAMTPVKAADLGGGCCADLEERVAELEATTARKGNRVVSLQVYGQINKALLIWDDGVDSDAYVVDHEKSGSRFGFKGKAKIKPGWTAGYQMEIGIQDNGSNKVEQGQGGDEGIGEGLYLRHNYFYIDSDKLGRISVGHQSTAADGAVEVVLGNSLSDSSVGAGANLWVRMPNGATYGKLKEWASNLDGERLDVIRYDSPAIMGFILSASWGENDYADVALRFKKEFNSIRLVAGIGYVWNHDTADLGGAPDAEEIAGSISAMHVPTGLYVAFAAADLELENTDYGKSMWYVQGGIEKKFLPYGSTTLYAEYGEYTIDYGAGVPDDLTTRLGFGVVQKIDSAAMDLYAQANVWSFDDGYEPDPEDLTTIMLGSRIKF